MKVSKISVQNFSVNKEEPMEHSGGQRSNFESAFIALNRWVLIGLLAVMSILVITNVISRYTFGYSFPWVEEVSRYMMIWVCFLGAGPALRVGGHIAIDTLHQSVSPSLAKFFRTVIVAIIGMTLVAIGWLGIDYALFAWEQETPVLGWSYGKIYLAMPIGSLLTLVHLMFVSKHWIDTAQWEQEAGFDPQAM